MSSNFKFQSRIFTLKKSEKYFHFYQPSQPDELLNSISDEQALKDKCQPYWSEHWPSSDTFIFFLSNIIFPSKMDILELGCGLGTLSTVLLAADHNVFSIDISPDACYYCKSNIELNGLKPKIFCCDINNLPFRKTFDLIIASDILYEDKINDPLLNCLDMVVSPTCKVLIADPCRRGWECFKSKASIRHYNIELLHSEICSNMGPRVEIIQLTKAIPL